MRGPTVQWPAFFLMIVASTASTTASQPLTTCPPIDLEYVYECRSVSTSAFVCDEANMTSIPTTRLPPNLSYLRINGTSLSVLNNCMLSGFTINTIEVENNLLLEAVQRDAFFGLKGLQILKIRGNKILNVQPLFEPFHYLDDLVSLYLEDNLVNDERGEGTTTMSSKLSTLVLKGNPLVRIEHEFFSPLRDSPLVDLDMTSCSLEEITPGSFDYLPQLQKVDLSDNYKLVKNTQDWKRLWPNLSWTNLRFRSNFLDIVPTSLLESVNHTLAILDLSDNVFVELGHDRVFPLMATLEVLILDYCRIKTIEAAAFVNLINLKEISLKANQMVQMPSALMLPSLNKITIQGLEATCKFVVPDGLFNLADMSNLEQLNLASLHLAPLHFNTFVGLTGLHSLSLEGSWVDGIEKDTFASVPGLRNLSLAYCTGLDVIPVDAFRGPDCLQVVDLTYIKIFPDEISSRSQFLGGGDFPLKHTKILNLTHSLSNIDDPLEHLALASMPDLEVLELSQNQIVSWNSTKFQANKKLRTLTMTCNRYYIRLTSAMLQDFKGLQLLDLSGNEFECNEAVRYFYQMVEKNKEIANVTGWKQGYGYICNEGPKKTSFAAYTAESTDINGGYPLWPNEDETTLAIIIGLGAGLTITVLVLGHVAYNNWWLVQYKIAKWRKRTREGPSSQQEEEPVYDAFVSYSNQDQEWVEGVLASNLEPQLRLCLHERDFELGRTIVDNIVDCLEKSKFCIVVMTTSYTKSHWCKFEASLALKLFHDDKLVTILLEEDIKTMSKTLKCLLKTRTYLPGKDQDFFKRLGFALTKADNGELAIVANTVL